MDEEHREYRQIGKRALELLAGIELERPQLDGACPSRFGQESDLPIGSETPC
jgi:hypothetical protein